jgi:hypothetical protein
MDISLFFAPGRSESLASRLSVNPPINGQLMPG